MGPRTVMQNAAGVAEIAAKIDVILGRLRQIEGQLRNPGPIGPTELGMTVDKAENAIHYLNGWSSAVERKLQGIRATAEIAAKRAQARGQKK